MINVLLAIEAIDDSKEREIIGDIFEQYSSYSKRVAYHYLNNASDAEDVMGNVFLKVIKYRHKFVGASKEKVKALIYLYTKCSAWDFIKKRDKFQFISYNNVYEDEHGNNFDLELSDNIDILRDIISVEAQDSIRMAVERLKHPAKEIIQLKFWEDHSNVEIAELLGINPSTISTIISRTVAKLKVEMEEYANE